MDDLLADDDSPPPHPGTNRPVKLEIGTEAGATSLQTAAAVIHWTLV
jgi:hypothetical protein